MDTTQAPITDEQKKRYIVQTGLRCPYCQSDQVASAPPFKADTGEFTQLCSCDDCNRAWENTYTLSDVKAIIYDDESWLMLMISKYESKVLQAKRELSHIEKHREK